MKVGLLQEGDLTGTDVVTRYHNLIEEAVLADKLGFSCWGTSEQHFSPPHFSVASTEVLYAAIAALTKNITLRPMAAVMLKFNHPILVAERLATLDIVSHGRAELCTARSNNLTTLATFGIAPKDTRAQFEDSLDVLIKALGDDILEHDGPIWQIPPREIVPKPMTKPYPNLSIAASSVETHGNAGRRGIGVITFENYFGFPYLQECLDKYREVFDATDHSSAKSVNDYRGLYVATAFCHEDRDEARRIARDMVLHYFEFILDLYIPLADTPGYTYLEEIKALIAHRDDVDWLCDYTPSVMVGTPDDFIERLQKLEAMGIDEVVLRVDGFGHENIMNTIQLIGEKVIPIADPLAKASSAPSSTSQEGAAHV